MAARALRVAVLAFAAVIGGIQILLSSPLLKWILNRASVAHFHLDYKSAWSIWPGTVHLDGLKLRAQDGNIQWSLVVDHADVKVLLTDLLRRRFHPTRVRAKGVEFALRQRLYRPEITKERLYGLPPIDGYAALPLKEEIPEEMSAEDKKDLWSIQLEDVEVVAARQIWIERLRFTGNAQASGSFFIAPSRRIAVEAQLQASPLALQLGDEPALRDLNGRIAVTMHPFDPRLVPGITKLRELSGLVKVDAQLAGLEFLQHLLPGQTVVTGGSGPIQIDLTVARGIVSKGTLDATLADLHAVGAGARGHADAHLKVRAKQDAAQPLTEVEVELAALTISPKASKLPPARIKLLRASAAADPIDLLAMPHLRTASLDIEGGKVPDLRLAQELLGEESGLQILGGSGELDAHFAGTLEGTKGRLVIAAHRAKISDSGITLRGEVRGTVQVEGRGTPFGKLRLDGTRLDVTNVDALQGDTASGPGWWGQFEIPKGSVDSTARTADLELRTQCRDARAIVALFIASGKLPGIVGGLFHFDHLRGGGGLRVAPGELALRNFEIKGNGAEVRANWRRLGKEKRGQALVKVGAIGVGLDLHPGGTSVILLNPTDWYLKRLKQEALLSEVRTQLPLGPSARAVAQRRHHPVGK